MRSYCLQNCIRCALAATSTGSFWRKSRTKASCHREALYLWALCLSAADQILRIVMEGTADANGQRLQPCVSARNPSSVDKKLSWNPTVRSFLWGENLAASPLNTTRGNCSKDVPSGNHSAGNSTMSFDDFPALNIGDFPATFDYQRVISFISIMNNY